MQVLARDVLVAGVLLTILASCQIQSPPTPQEVNPNSALGASALPVCGAINIRAPLKGSASDPVIVTDYFGRVRSSSTHKGIDFRAQTAKPVVAAAAGKAYKATQAGTGWGNYIYIKHSNGTKVVAKSLYAHLSRVDITNGQEVTAGQVIGMSGNSGNAAWHLHFELFAGDPALSPSSARVDPYDCWTLGIEKRPYVAMSPETVQLKTGQKQMFSATVYGFRPEVKEDRVKWTATAGTIDEPGAYQSAGKTTSTYTAPTTPGTYQVRATSTFFSKVYKEITVQVYGDCYGKTPTHILSQPAAQTFYGTTGNDVIIGTEGNDKIDGRGGDDYICGFGGNDFIHGQEGVDTLNGGPGDDEIYGGVGNDVITGALGNDRLFGELNDDKIYGFDGNDHLDGGQGNDYLNGEVGDDRVFGNLGNDQVYGGKGNDDISGETGSDGVYGGPGYDISYGGVNPTYRDINAWNAAYGLDINDTLIDEADGGILDGGDGADYIKAIGGTPDRLVSQIRGMDGADTIEGGSGEWLIYGGPGNDEILAGLGKNDVYGGYGDDRLFTALGTNPAGSSDSGRDFLFGNDGIDSLFNFYGSGNHLDCGPGDLEMAAVNQYVQNYTIVNCEKRGIQEW